MNWKLKALGQAVLSGLPGSSSLNYWGQKLVTRAHRDFGPVAADRLEKARWFVRQFHEHRGQDLNTAQFFEFGAGWDLAGPLALYCLGAGRQRVVDVSPCARVELVNRIIEELNRSTAELPRCPEAPARSLRELEARFGISYRAPTDARQSAMSRASVDCIVNTYTLEHIPVENLEAILAESFRILKPGGLLLSVVDYQDHYSYRDAGISVYNFLRYTERQWRWFNSPLHYQNRLRHSQYRRLFAKAGFEILSEELKRPEATGHSRFQLPRLAAQFQSFSPDDLTILASAMVCRREASSPLDGGARLMACGTVQVNA